MRLHVQHATTYSYAEPVPWALQQLRLTPRSSALQAVRSWDVTLDGADLQVAFIDNHGNQITVVTPDPGRSEFTISAAGEVDTFDKSGVSGPHLGPMPLWGYRRSTPLTEAGPGILSLVESLGVMDSTPIQIGLLHDLSAAVLDAVEYEMGYTTSQSTANDAIAAGTGVCQDHSHIFISACRALDIPARYVSGYLLRDDTEEQAASHAWSEAHLPTLGWIGFDVSNGISPDERYIRIATGLDYRDAAPVSGLRAGGGTEQLTVSLQIGKAGPHERTFTQTIVEGGPGQPPQQVQQ